jgi:SAM-dependent methyltransferase
MSMNCISCKHKSLKLFLKTKHAPACVQVIPESLLSKDKKVTITVLKCERCSLVQLSKDSYVDKLYYDDYLMSRAHSSFGEIYQKSLAKKFVLDNHLEGKKIVDVGSGDGYFSELLEEQGAKVTGVEPSKIAVDLAKKRGLKVIQDYIDDNFQSSVIYNAFVTCQVFEHISDPGKLLKNIKRITTEESYGLIEVPSLIKSLSDNRFYDFFPDHVAYYTPTSLSYMAEINGYDVLSINHTANNEYISAFLKRKRYIQNNKEIQRSADEYKKEFRAFLEKAKSKKIAIWGAGAKGITSLSSSNINTANIICVDSDPNKHGRYMPGTHILVNSPDILKKEKPQIVVVSAMMYKDEIIKTLKDKYGFVEKQIAIIAPYPKFLQK